MRLLTYILAILLFLPVKARGEAIDTPVEPLLLYKAKQDTIPDKKLDINTMGTIYS